MLLTLIRLLLLGTTTTGLASVCSLLQLGCIVCFSKSMSLMSVILASLNFHLCGHFDTNSLLEFKQLMPVDLDIHFFSQTHSLQNLWPFVYAGLDSKISHSIWNVVLDSCRSHMNLERVVLLRYRLYLKSV